ncbi:MAG: hypothetical protein J5887_06320 [Erysipelotrichaceae bacterium]|nr:hypothetical protein [Erysipelotrichaceae bacterium]
MKKLFIILLTIALLLGVCGCKGKSDEDLIRDAVADYLTSILAQPMQLLSGNDEIVSHNGSDSVLWPILNEMMKRMTYKIAKTTIDGDRATVDLEFASYDLGKSYSEMVKEYIDAIVQIFAQQGSWSDDEIVGVMTECWQKTLGEAEESGLTRITPFTMELTRTAEGWKVSDCLASQDFLDIISGGILSAFGSLDE